MELIVYLENSETDSRLKTDVLLFSGHAALHYLELWPAKSPSIPDFSFYFYPFSKIHSPTLQVKVHPGKGRGNGSAAGPTRGGTIHQQERSSGITPASATAAGNSATPSRLVPVDPPRPGSARRLRFSSNRSAALPTRLTVSTTVPFWY